MADVVTGSPFIYPMGSFYQDLDDRIKVLETAIGTGIGGIPDGAITDFKLADNAVSTRTIQDGAVSGPKLGVTSKVNLDPSDQMLAWTADGHMVSTPIVSSIPVGAAILVYGNGATSMPGFIQWIPGFEVTSAYPQLRTFGLANGWAVNGNGNPVLPSAESPFLRLWRQGQTGPDAGRAFGSVQTDQNKAHSHPVNDPGHHHSETGLQSSGGSIDQANGAMKQISTLSTGTSVTGVTIGNNTDGGAEVRVLNITMTLWIKAYDAALNQTFVDVAALASQVDAYNGRITSLENRVVRASAVTIAGVAQDTLLPQIPGLELYEFTLDFVNVTPAASMQQAFQLVMSSGPVATGYNSYASGWNTGLGFQATTAQITTAAGAVATAQSGKIVFRRLGKGSLTWMFTMHGNYTSGSMMTTGYINLAAEPTAIRYTSVAGTVAFTAGWLNLERKYG